VEIVEAGCGCLLGGLLLIAGGGFGLALLLRRRVAARGFAVAVVTALVVVATTLLAAAAVEHLHLVGDDLGGVAILAVLALPFAGAQAAFDVDFRALAQILAGDFSQAVEEHDPVPLGALLGLAGVLVLPRFGGRQR